MSYVCGPADWIDLGMSNRIAWGSLMATPQKEAVAMLADSWNSR